MSHLDLSSNTFLRYPHVMIPSSHDCDTLHPANGRCVIGQIACFPFPCSNFAYYQDVLSVVKSFCMALVGLLGQDLGAFTLVVSITPYSSCSVGGISPPKRTVLRGILCGILHSYFLSLKILYHIIVWAFMFWADNNGLACV